MKYISYTQKLLPMKKVLAVLLLIFSPLILWESIFMGIFAFGIGLNMIATEGSQIDLESKNYRNIKSILGIKFGTWKALPEFEYVSVFKTKKSTQVNAMGATMATFKNDTIYLNLFYKGNKHITFYETDDKNDAFKVAEHFKLALDIDILDATGSENKWL